MANKVKYRIRCTHENKWVYTDFMLETDSVPTTCPNGATHSVDTDMTCIVESGIDASYLIYDDVDGTIKEKSHESINYKTELVSGVAYTPVYIIGKEGATAGLLMKTEYYKDYVDSNNKGTLVLEVTEDYIIDNSDTNAEYSRRPVLSRVKKWKYYKTDNTLDETNTKEKPKLYNTRTKRHQEGIRRRENITEQLIDNIGLAGILSGIFTDEDDAHVKLTLLQEDYSAAFTAWINSGLGTLYNDITNDSSHTWLDSTIVDTANTQAMCTWMIGLTLKNYMVDKLKGNIQ